MDTRKEDNPEEHVDPTHPQETFRKVLFGQIAEPLVPPPPEPEETLDDELTRLAMAEPLAPEPEQGGPTLWRLVVLLAFAVIALGIVFW